MMSLKVIVLLIQKKIQTRSITTYLLSLCPLSKGFPVYMLYVMLYTMYIICYAIYYVYYMLCYILYYKCLGVCPESRFYTITPGSVCCLKTQQLPQSLLLYILYVFRCLSRVKILYNHTWREGALSAA